MGKNINKVREMLAGNHKANIQVGYGDQESQRIRKAGDQWTDLDGVEWEQKNGYVSKVTRMPDVGIFSKVCKDCSRNCSRMNNDKRHFETWKRMERCFHCQINFEVDLKSKKIGINGNKWQFWVKLQLLQRWDAIDLEVQHLVLHNADVKHHDKPLLNALANENQRQTREKIKSNT